MASLYKLLHVAAAAITVLLMGLTIATVDACRCMDLSVCDKFEAADVVVHGTVLRGSGRRHRRRRSGNDDIKYTLEVTTVYKGEPDVNHRQKMKFTTANSGSLCGVTLEKGEEYLLGLYDTDGKLTANSCGLVAPWSSITDEDKVSVEDACEDDPCNGTCKEFQECLLYTTGEYYCADVCEPSPCADNEVCSFRNIQCIRGPCPPPAICRPA